MEKGKAYYFGHNDYVKLLLLSLFLMLQCYCPDAFLFQTLLKDEKSLLLFLNFGKNERKCLLAAEEEETMSSGYICRKQLSF